MTITRARALTHRTTELRSLYAAASPAAQDAITHWLYLVKLHFVAGESAASLLLAALENWQEPDEDQPRLWYEWLHQAERDGLPRLEAVNLIFSAEEISRQIFQTHE
jgi:hypothetical protein